jgi:threonine dehydrogenase-like Zn-dependent dehydrogenase
MKAVRNAPPTVEVVEVDEPAGEGVLVRVSAAGICASDLSYLRWGSKQIAGHEFAGTLADGKAVAVEPIFGCADCSQCRLGSFNRCERGPTGLGMTDPGAMCEWFLAPQRALVPLPVGVEVKDAFLIEPASVAWHACHLGSVGPDTRVAVVGAGAIGVLAAVSAQTLGTERVALEGRYRHQHEARERIGADEPEGTYDVVIETAGSESGLHRAVELARPGGTVVYVGIYEDISWPHNAAFTKEVALRPSLGYCGHAGRREFAEAADMLASRPEVAATLITHRYPVEEAERAFEVAGDRSQGVFRVAIDLGDDR